MTYKPRTYQRSYQRSIQLSVVDCCVCGVVYGIPKKMDTQLKRDGQEATTYCPNGHQWVYSDSLEKELRAANARAIHAEDQLRAARGELTSLRKRAANGVCPCCHRTFQQLTRHMKAKHPDFPDG
jgi:hypothetical protein